MYKYLFFILLILITSCNSADYDLTPLNYDKSVNIKTEYGIKTEGANPNDNLIFSKCNSFSYKYFVEKEGKKYLSKLVGPQQFPYWEGYELIDIDSAKNELCVDRFLLFTPTERPSNATTAPTQSLIKSQWIKNDGTILMDNNEGIIENYENFWMHPFRSLHMWPTFTAPWPYVNYPIEIGQEYNWWKKLDSGWGSDKYVQWDSIVHFDYTYKVTGTGKIEVQKKKIDCYIIEATGTSPIGNTSVKFYFNPTIGFTKMDYRLMDESRIVLYLDDFELNCDESLEPPKENSKHK